MIRKAVSDDASRLAEILIFAKRTAYRSIFHNDYVSFQEMQVLDLALHYRNDAGALEHVYVYDDGIVKGMMHWGLPSMSCQPWELKELYIEPFFQGQGVGRKLMLDFLSNVEASPSKTAFLWVLEANRVARIFYETFGFRPNGTRCLQPDTEAGLLQYEKIL